VYIAELDINNPSTWQKMDIRKVSMREVFAKFGLEDNTIDFIGHAVALYPNDNYLEEPALECIKKI